MRFLNNGEQLTAEELLEIANNFYVSKHARQRIYERGMTIKEAKQIMKKPFLAYFNTDGTINIAKDKYNYFVMDWSEFNKNYTMITYKEKSYNAIDIITKMEIAKKGIDRKK